MTGHARDRFERQVRSARDQIRQEQGVAFGIVDGVPQHALEPPPQQPAAPWRTDAAIAPYFSCTAAFTDARAFS